MTFLKYKKAWIIPLVIALVVGIVGLWSRARVGTELKTKLAQEIHTVLHANSTALTIWLDDQKRLATALTQDSEISENLIEILDDETLDIFPDNMENGPGPRKTPNLSIGQHEFARLFGMRSSVLKFPAAILVNLDGTIVADSRPRGRLIGRKVFDDHLDQFDELFDTGKPVFITPFKVTELVANQNPNKQIKPGNPNRNPRMERRPRQAPRFARQNRELFEKSLMQVAVPVKDEDNEVIGALSVIIDAGNEFSRILSVARPGDTGETLAIDGSGLMLSKSRFDKSLKETGLLSSDADVSALNLHLRDPGKLIKSPEDLPENLDEMPLTYFAEQTLDRKGEGVEVEAVRDYRGEKVVGGWKWMPQLGFGIITKIDEAEACKPLHVLTLVFIALFLLLILFAMGMVTFSYLNISLSQKFNLAQIQAKQLGQYTLETKIGEGGMGVVYKARHALLRRETAIKLLSPEVADGDAIARFEREVKMTCRLTHPNTIQVYDYGHTPEGIFYYAMEFLQGTNLQQMMSMCGPQPESHVIYILTSICESLNEAHMEGLIHRDIKPANIFLCERGGMPEVVKVLDFGLVKEYSESQTLNYTTSTSTSFTGTPNFMSPESVVDADQVNHLSDIYAVGAIGHYLLTGEHLFPEATSVAEICKAQLDYVPLDPSDRIGRQVCQVLEGIIMSCLHKNPDERPQSAIELFNMLQECPDAGVWNLSQRIYWWNETHSDEERFEILAMETASAEALNIDITQRV